MIRVFRGRAGELFRSAREGPPLLAGANPVDVRVQLVSKKTFEVNEAIAIERALVELPSGDADIVVAPGGSLYKIFAVSEVTRPRPAPAEPAVGGPRWTALDRSARVLVVGRENAIVRVGELLKFLGYHASALILDGPGSLEAALAKHDPHVVVLGSSVAGPNVSEKVRARGSGVVVLGGARDGADGMIDVPIATEKVAPVLEPIVERVRKSRGR